MVGVKRYLFDQVLNDLKKKIVFITGPRQVGKTFLAKQVLKEFNNAVYLNYDNDEDRKIILKRTWRLNTDLIIFDEIHKMKNWKMYLNYLRTKDGKEIDFVIAEDDEIRYLLEVKLSDSNLSKSLLSFSQQFPQAESFQLVHNLRQEEYIKGINLSRAGDFLAKLDA